MQRRMSVVTIVLAVLGVAVVGFMTIRGETAAAPAGPTTVAASVGDAGQGEGKGRSAEAEKLVTAAAQLSGNSGKEEIIALLKNASDLNRELNTRWLEITQRVFAIQDRLQQQLA